MNILNIFKKKKTIKKENPNTEDNNFSIRIDPFKSNPQYFWVEYTINNGRTWTYIQQAKSPFCNLLSNDWKMENFFGDTKSNSLHIVKTKFTSHQSILDYEEFEQNIVDQGNSHQRQLRNEQKRKEMEKYKEQLDPFKDFEIKDN